MSTIRPCAGPCGRMTRPASVKAEDAPGTVCRLRDGKCKPCVAGNGKSLVGVPSPRGGGIQGLAKCAGTCGRMTRTSRMPKAKFPDAVVRTGAGMCNSCRRRADPKLRARLQEADRKRHAAAAEVAGTVRKELDAYLASRRAREQKRTAGRPAVRSHHGYQTITRGHHHPLYQQHSQRLAGQDVRALR